MGDVLKEREEEKEREKEETLKALKALQEIPSILREILEAIRWIGLHLPEKQ